MSENEAIERLEYLKCKADVALATTKTNCSWLKDDVKGTNEALQMAISAIKVVQQYRATGFTPEELDGINFNANQLRLVKKLREYYAIGTPEELRAMKEHGGFTGIELAEIAAALSTLNDYRKIGTPEECRAAVEKQTPKRPDYEGDGYADGQLVYDTWICPCCGKRYEVDYDNYDCCPKCGQKLKREDER